MAIPIKFHELLQVCSFIFFNSSCFIKGRRYLISNALLSHFIRVHMRLRPNLTFSAHQCGRQLCIDQFQKCNDGIGQVYRLQR